jgi:hypothetical protein
VGTDDEMSPRVQLGSVPFAVQALTVPDGSVTTAKIADGAVTSEKLSRTLIRVEPSGSITFGNSDTWYDVLSTNVSLQQETQVTIYATIGLQYGADTLMAADITIDGTEILHGQSWTRGGIGETIPLNTSLLLGPGDHQIVLRGYSGKNGAIVNVDKRTLLVVVLG